MKTCEYCGRVNTQDVTMCESCGAILKRVIMVNWSGQYPSMYFGMWSISVNGKQLPIPADKRRGSMGTYGTYTSWHFTPDWNEVIDHYQDGSAFNVWFDDNREWLFPALNEIGEVLSERELIALYDAISEQDWRSGSCGGCI